MGGGIVGAGATDAVEVSGVSRARAGGADGSGCTGDGVWKGLTRTTKRGIMTQSDEHEGGRKKGSRLATRRAYRAPSLSKRDNSLCQNAKRFIL